MFIWNSKNFKQRAAGFYCTVSGTGSVRQARASLGAQAAEIELSRLFRHRFHAAVEANGDQPRGKPCSPHLLQGRDVLFRPGTC